MSETIQVRGVPKKVHAELVRRAKLAGLSLNKYLLSEFERMTRVNRNAELFKLADALPGPRPTREQILQAIRDGREEQEQKLDRLYGPDR
jgi:hypothetical protein